MVQRILIAESDVATRVARSCKRLGIATVAAREVVASITRDEVWDDVMELPRASSAETWLELAKNARVDAVHPGDSSVRVQQVLSRVAESAGITFVGTTPASLDVLEDRARVRDAASEIGIRTVPAIFVDDAGEIANAESNLRSIPFPIVLKAKRVGTGVPSMIVRDPQDVMSALRTMFRECEKHGVRDGVIAEHYIDRARHIETWMAVGHNDVSLTIGERECSLREGTHRILCESPSPVITSTWDGEALREALTDGAIRLVQHLKGRGIMGVAFLLDPEGRFWFSRVRAGLPLEHALFEMTTGLDMVELQLRVAREEALPEEVEPSGHAIQAHILPHPAAGNGDATKPRVVEELRWPPTPQGKVRLESGIKVGTEVTSHGDLLARVTAFAPIRHRAVLMLDRILAESHIAPVKTNIDRIRRLLGHESFRAGQYDNGFLERFEQEAG